MRGGALIHAVGFMRAYDLGRLGALLRPRSHAEGLTWLVTGLVFVGAHGRKAQAAELPGISRITLWRGTRDLGLGPPG